MADRDAYYLAPARRFYDTRDRAEQEEISRLILSICEYPFSDGVLKFQLPFPPHHPTLYRDGSWVVIYDEENNWTLAIWDIGYDQDDTTVIPRPRT